MALHGTCYELIIKCHVVVIIKESDYINTKEVKGGIEMESQENFENHVIDPVCGMNVDTKHPRALATYEGDTYYFCADGCRKAFEANPKEYLNGKHPKRKGWWGRYLVRLEKATGGKSFNCH